MGFTGDSDGPSNAPAKIKVSLVNGHVTRDIYSDESGKYYELKPVSIHDLQFDDDVTMTSEHTDTDDSFDKHSNNIVYQLQNCLSESLNKNQKFILNSISFLLLVAYTVYFVFALLYDVEMSMALIVFTALGIAWLAYAYIRDHFGDTIYNTILHPIESLVTHNWDIIKWFLYPAMIIATILYLALDVIHDLKQLQSLSGFILFTLVMYISSVYPDRIRWRPVVWGFVLQFLLAMFVLRWEYGYIAVKFLSDEITKFIEYGYEGGATVFGDPFLIFHPFSFMAMPLLIYIGAVMAILYYWGLTQSAACKVGWLMQITLGTTAIETLNTAANIFLNGMDTMLMMRHYLDKLTRSELNCYLVGNHSTVAGFVFALFVLFGAPPQHLLSAAVMSAPATIAIAKLNYPETEESITKEIKDVKLTKGDDINIFEAAANGAAVAAKTVAAVVSCYIAFMSLLAFINATLSWLGGRVGHSELSFELICSYIFWPLALVIGIDVNECQESAKLIGLKIFTSELLAYQELGRSVKAGLLNPRSQALTTYAMCGFSSVSTLAIAVGVWNAICPQRVKQMASSMFRVLVQANISCFMTACIAGLFYSEEMIANFDTSSSSPAGDFIGWILSLLPSYSQLLNVADF